MLLPSRVTAEALVANFSAEIVPVVVPGPKGERTVSVDEGPRADTDLPALANFAPRSARKAP